MCVCIHACVRVQPSYQSGVVLAWQLVLATDDDNPRQSQSVPSGAASVAAGRGEGRGGTEEGLLAPLS